MNKIITVQEPYRRRLRYTPADELFSRFRYAFRSGLCCTNVDFLEYRYVRGVIDLRALIEVKQLQGEREKLSITDSVIAIQKLAQQAGLPMYLVFREPDLSRLYVYHAEQPLRKGELYVDLLPQAQAMLPDEYFDFIYCLRGAPCSNGG